MKNRIHSKGERIYEEAAAGAAGILPGMLIMLNSSGEAIVHATEGGRAEAAFAEEDAKQGAIVSTAYTNGDILSYLLPTKGGEVNVLIEDGQDIAIGDHLISAGNGKMKAASDVSSAALLLEVLAVATEANDLTGSNTVDKLSAARII